MMMMMTLMTSMMIYSTLFDLSYLQCDRGCNNRSNIGFDTAEWWHHCSGWRTSSSCRQSTIFFPPSYSIYVRSRSRGASHMWVILMLSSFFILYQFCSWLDYNGIISSFKNKFNFVSTMQDIWSVPSFIFRKNSLLIQDEMPGFSLTDIVLWKSSFPKTLLNMNLQMSRESLNNKGERITEKLDPRKKILGQGLNRLQ